MNPVKTMQNNTNTYDDFQFSNLFVDINIIIL